MYLGCHAVLFKSAIAEDTEGTLAKIAGAGAQCVEIGARFFGTEKSEYLKEQLAAHGLVLSGMHVGNDLVDFLDKPEECKQKLIDAAECLKIIGCKNIVMSAGVPPEGRDVENLGDDRLCDPETVAQIVKAIEADAVYLMENYGISLNYHNHNWEFKHDGLIYKALLEQTKVLKFGLDIGWCGVSGYPAISLIKSAPERFQYIHIRDYDVAHMATLSLFDTIQEDYCEVGEGDSGVPELCAYLKEVLPEDACVLIEYERGAEDITRYEKAMAFVKPLLKD